MTPCIFGIAGPTLSDEERGFFREAEPAGYILFARNCESTAQMRALTDDLRDLHGRDRLFVCIDQEGGRVARMKPPTWPAFPAGEAFDRLYRQAPISAMEAARVNALALALELSAAGVTVDCHPPLDLRHEGMHDVIGDRALGSDPMQVAALGRMILDGLAEGGVAGCIKHMPGHGRTTVDTHRELPTVSQSADELTDDLLPFQRLAHAPIGMTGHLLFPCWDAERPATLSPTIVSDVIRGTMGFDGLLLTDDIDMEALDGSIAERGEAAIAAGCDLVLNCWAKRADMEALVERLPPLAQQGSERLERALADTATEDRREEVAALLDKRDRLLALTEEAA